MRETFRFDTASFETLSCFISSHHAEHAIGYCHCICEHYSSNTSSSVSSPLLNPATSETLAHSISPRHPLSLFSSLLAAHHRRLVSSFRPLDISHESSYPSPSIGSSLSLFPLLSMQHLMWCSTPHLSNQSSVVGYHTSTDPNLQPSVLFTRLELKWRYNCFLNLEFIYITAFPVTF